MAQPRIDRAGLSATVMYVVQRVRARFKDDIGNERTCLGTGFWLNVAGKLALVTNRHNLDPALKYPEMPDLRLVSFDIELRDFAPQVFPPGRTTFCPVQIDKTRLLLADGTDCALVVGPKIALPAGTFFPQTILQEKDLADQSFFSDQVMAMENAVFIGFPGRGENPWFDTDKGLPIARQALIASIPGFPFTNPAVTIGDTVLVSGFAFSGSSGSPVLLPRHGIAPGGDIRDPAFRPPKLIGVMAAALFDAHDMFRHTGLSLFVRSTTIIELVARARASGLV